MRKTIVRLALVLFLGWPAAASALQENQVSFIPEGGYAFLTGDLGEMVAGDLAFGASFAYGITDYWGIEAGGLYSLHQQRDEDETGRIDLGHFFGGVGPRVNWPLRYAVPFTALQFGPAFIRYKAEWGEDDDKETAEQSAHAFGGMLSVGIDFYVHDSFTVGLGFRGGYFVPSLEYTHRDADAQEAGPYACLAGTLRLALLF